MECKNDLDNKMQQSGVIVRRKFVPIKFSIHKENQFVSAGAKLPFTANRILGVLTTTTISPCTDTAVPPRYYFGVSESRMMDASFMKTDPGKVYEESYPPDVLMNANPGKWYYYAHPVLDKFPTILTNVDFQEIQEPIPLQLSQQGQCSPDNYYLWSGALPLEGTLFITFNLPIPS